jgi:dipeptidyl aminopeptidase/acylaminoacyl peptidase
MKKSILLLLFAAISIPTLFSQQDKRALNHDDIESWKRITETLVSPDGKVLAYKTEPWRGDTELFIYSSKGDKISSFKNASSASFTQDSKFLVFEILPETDKVRELTLLKTKREEMPLKGMGIYDIGKNSLSTTERLRGFSLAEKWSGWIAYQVEPAIAKKDEKPAENGETGNSQSKGKKESAKNGYTLFLLNTSNSEIVSFPFVTSYSFAKESAKVIFSSTGDDNGFDKGVYLYGFENGVLSPVFKGDGEFKQIVISDNGLQAAFLFSGDGKRSGSEYSLYSWSGSGEAEKIADSSSSFLLNGWEISANGRLQFSGDNNRLFFGTSPIMPEKDTTILEDEYPVVDIWHGTEGVLHTVQVVSKNRDLRKSWMAVIDLKSKKVMQLGTPEIDDITLIEDGNSDFVLGITNLPYQLQSMWEGGPDHYDMYLINMVTGNKKIIKKDIRANVQASPGGKYLTWYDYLLESMFTYEITTGKEYRITSPDKIVVAQELNDIPNLPGPYRPTGWLDNDEKLLLNDRYDIWIVDPANRSEPVNMTINGRTTKTGYSNISFDREKRFFSVGEDMLLLGFNEVTRESSYFSLKAGKADVPKKIMGGAYSLSSPVKAKNSSTLVYSKETFETFPDLWVSDLSFKKSVRVSNANPQQAQFTWGSAELYSWTSLDGLSLEGLLYKPANFDPSKKYPMIVNFYEKSSEGLYNHRIPELHRSTVDYHYYTSNGYVVFNPDIYYTTGYPGEDAFNCIMPGITALIAEGFVDKDHIGAQGHSWGGYQVAYLATRTDLFAAIESGAPVVNMFSAYGGIRWASGLNRSFQYEHTQSRIGATIWESPLRYIENSPIFTMDKVTTPILIMHNDSDGHVPWYQGIEYFTSLRRLQKPVWMLNYNGEPHWPQKLANKKDFQIRMAQFFDHFLKEKPMPIWMKEGIPAIKKEYELGYDLVEK